MYKRQTDTLLESSIQTDFESKPPTLKRRCTRQNCSRRQMPTPFSRLLENKSEDLLVAVLSQCESHRLMACVAPVCKSWAGLVESVLQARCAERHWQLARRPRSVTPTIGPYRALWVQRACRGCFNAPGDLAVRDTPRGGTRFLLCRKCCLSERMRTMLVQKHLCFDTLGLTGRPLPDNKWKRKISKRNAPLGHQFNSQCSAHVCAYLRSASPLFQTRLWRARAQ